MRCGGPAPVRRALLAARERTLALADRYADALGAQGLRVRYDPALNPPLWELGHIGWFQEWWVGRNRQRSDGTRCDPEHGRAPSLLAQADAWYDSSRLPHRDRWELPLPDAAATRAYMAHSLAQTMELLDQLPSDAGDDALYFFRLVALHEAMHAEAAVYMARALGVPAPGFVQDIDTGAGVDNNPIAQEGVVDLEAHAGAIVLPGQSFRLGYSGPGFAFDNELGAHEVRIEACEIDAAPVSWSRFLEFIAAGGYDEARWWDQPGWAWRQQARPVPPAPSERDAASLAAPAIHVSAFEAQAWCRWAGRRLPTEAEWECAARTAPGFRWGHAFGAASVWEWTASQFQPYPGFVAHPYRDYSAPWFGSRRVLRGASHATSPELADPRYRNFFEPHRTDICAGFRSCA